MPKHQEKTPESGHLSLSFDPESLAQGIRVKPAQFARMCNVSRQTVSQWIKRGLVQTLPDGTLDPAKAAKRVIQNTDPARLRARIFKDATKSVDDWKLEAKRAKDALGAAMARIEYLESAIREADLTDELFKDAVAVSIDEFHAAPRHELRYLLENEFDDCTIRAGQQLGFIENT